MPDCTQRSGLRGPLIGFDFGLKRIGVAVGQMLTRTSSPLQVISHDKTPDWIAIEALMREWRPCACVVGLPLSLSGEETVMSGKARAFGQQLENRFSLPVYYNDERLSSKDAESRFADRRAQGLARKKDAAMLDSVAAGIILESWLNMEQ